MVEETTAASHALAQETEALARLIGRFEIGREPAAVVSLPRSKAPSQKPPAVGPTFKTSSSRGGGTSPRKTATALAEDAWEEF
jgi:methyl-accepting chemotaxis protein